MCQKEWGCPSMGWKGVGWTVERAGARPGQALACDFVYTPQVLQGSKKEEGRETETTRDVTSNSQGGLEL